MNNLDNKCSNERSAIIFQWLSGWQTAAAHIRKTGKVDMVAVAKVSTHPDFLLGAMDHYAAMMIEIDEDGREVDGGDERSAQSVGAKPRRGR